MSDFLPLGRTKTVATIGFFQFSIFAFRNQMHSIPVIVSINK